MLVMDGMEFLKRIRTEAAYTNINLHSAVGVDANTCVETGVKAAQGISVA